MDNPIAPRPSIAFQPEEEVHGLEDVLIEGPGHCRLEINIKWVDEDKDKVIAECVDVRNLYHMLKSTQRANAPIRIQQAFEDIRNPLTTELLAYIEELESQQAPIETIIETKTLDDVNLE